MQVVMFTHNLELYALVAGALRKEGWKVSWKEGRGLALADLDFLGQGQVWLWRTPRGLRAYDPGRQAFLTRGDDPRTLASGLRGQVGLRLSPGEARVLEALGRGLPPQTSLLARSLGQPLQRIRFHLKGLRNKFGLPLEDLLRLARHQVQVTGLEGYPDALARVQAEPLLHVPGQEQGEGYRAQKAAPVGQTLGVQAL